MKSTRSRTRKDSDKSQSSVKSDNSIKRVRESPETNSDTKEKPIKILKKNKESENSPIMADNNETQRLQMAFLIAQVSKIDTLLESVNDIQREVQKISEKQIESDKKLLKVEKRMTSMEQEIENIKSHNNELAQDSLSRDFVIFGLPFFEKANNNKVIASLARETGVKFDISDLQYFYASRTAKDRKKCVVHGRFHFEKYKSNLISECRNKSPILVEDIIELKPDDPMLGTEIHIRSQLTTKNRELANEARRQRSKGKLKFVWEKDGRILIRKTDNSSIVQLRSMNQLIQLVTELQPTTNHQHPYTSE